MEFSKEELKLIKIALVGLYFKHLKNVKDEDVIDLNNKVSEALDAD